MSDGQIQEVDGRFVISSGGTWLPGSYESFEAAEYAFGFDADLLQRFQEAANKTPNPEERVIRLASMKGFAGLRKGGNWVRIARRGGFISVK